MIKKITSIKNLAVYQNFEWDKSVVDKAGKKESFKKVNIIYGRNYSGKTSLSRIVRSLETGHLSEKYNSPEFIIEMKNGVKVTHDTKKEHEYLIRVFNEDFVRENLKFISNPDENITSFAILGDDNNKTELQIKALENRLGSDVDNTGMLGKLNSKQSDFNNINSTLLLTKEELDAKLSVKANKVGVGIKHDRLIGDPNYNISKLKKDIALIPTVKIPYSELTIEENTERLRNILKEEPKPYIEIPLEFNLKLKQLIYQVQSKVQMKISLSEQLQDLVEDALLQKWVREGKELHEGLRNTCGFCGSKLEEELMEKLNKHFNVESEILRKDLIQIIKEIEEEGKRLRTLLNINQFNFYKGFEEEVGKIKLDFDDYVEKYMASLDSLKLLSEIKRDNIFQSIDFDNSIVDYSPELIEGRKKYESICKKMNEYISNLSKKQKDAKDALRLLEVQKYIIQIKYSDEIKKISSLEQNKETLENELKKIKLEVNNVKNEIIHLKKQLKDESKGAEKVNYYLNNFFGHQSLKLEVIEDSTGNKFEVTRNGKKAHHLSEGECSLVAFCYFMAKLEDIETINNKPIIWIDDPISSLDSNHIFFVYGLINDRIVSCEGYEQLFISTHNLDFLKYLKRLDSNPKDFFLIDRSGSESSIKLMPTYLKQYVTEFNYLFHQIYICANTEIGDVNFNYQIYYNYANNARKFLESYLFYRYPNANEKVETKWSKFFGDDNLAVTILNRIHNEYSHLDGALERSLNPIDIPEMKNTAKYILRKIEEKDPEHYKALLESIDIITQAV